MTQVNELANQAFQHPQDRSSTVWRYLDTMKLLHILRVESLYLCRLDVLEDKSEGQMPPQIQEQYIRELQRLNAGLSDHVALACVEFLNDKWLKETLYANSWCLRDCEDALLWYRYASSGFAICSTFEKLDECARSNYSEACQVHASLVEYVDYQNVRADFNGSEDQTWNLFTFPTLKDQIFEGEREVRLVAWMQPQVGDKGRIEKDDWLAHPNGISVKIDPSRLIERIVASSSIPEWHIEYVRALIREKGLDIPVERSKVSV